MELLIIGIDGGDEKIISQLNMPNLQALLKNNYSYDTKEDLCSRGWAEILSGKHAIETGAFYMKSKLDGSRDVTDGFSVRDYKRDNIIPLWELVNNSGKSIGMMNVPTTKYAPEVNGFFVSGAGGGLVKGVDDVPLEFCYPSEVADILNERKYILDTRLMPSGIKEMDVFISRLRAMMIKRTECFIALNDKYNVDIGFVSYVATQRLQQAAMSELQEVFANNGKTQNYLQKEMVDLAYQFDLQVGDLIEKLKPEHVMVVSDHGQVKYLYNINFNIFLKEIGLWGTGEPDKAFQLYYSSGIFVNDERFENIVTADEEKDKLIDYIIEEFNSHPQTEIFSMKARRYRSLHPESPFQDLLPDIWIDKPDYMHTCDWGRGYISMNKHYGPIYGFRSITSSINSGLKGSKALLSAPFKYDSINNDLTGAYQIVEKYLKGC